MNIQLPPKIKEFIDKLNENGIPLPILRDQLTGQPSITYTLVLVSSVLCVLGLIDATKHLVDYDRAFSLLQWCFGSYLIRKGMAHVAPINDDKEPKQ